jgi:hypothetical protein
MRAEDHRVTRAALAIARRPHPPQQELVAAQPHERVVEGGEALFLLQLFPRAGVHLPAHALDVEQLFRKIQAVGFEADVLDVVIPSRMLAKSGQRGVSAGFRTQPAAFLHQETLVKFAHIVARRDSVATRAIPSAIDPVPATVPRI